MGEEVEGTWGWSTVGQGWGQSAGGGKGEGLRVLQGSEGQTSMRPGPSSGAQCFPELWALPLPTALWVILARNGK